ncbi:small, acid-soluble spore protein, alpha/beta type [Paenibacillus sp. HJL G12]|uniref:Small, acid-soluble spore protein, alpha/beta type n=1 Tax=Paenibacillus dendrobii TaxID=2691084 RepID=A0A7X3LKL0_9BACL|nr:alpha/beta-type small acid-soluble spore protein [Paenibacillus dendrobii]MWV46594.1 small, acid-soluble spore protein, alpha/beta type [Paenibacillus dendrobii]
MARNNNRKVVPESRNVLNQMKYEIAAEFGLGAAYGGSYNAFADTEFGSELGEAGGAFTGGSGYGGHLTSRENGSVGGEMTKRLIRQAQQSIL